MSKSLLLITGLFLLASCSHYLDVKPKSQVDKDVLFQTEAGFMESLIGVYSRCAKEDIYGNELTFGILDVIAQNYTVTSDNAYTYDPQKHSYQQTAVFNFREVYFTNRKNAIWSGLYNAISNCNLILANIDAQKKVFTNEVNYQLTKGEALALRAYLHFDLLRLFAPAYQRNPDAPAIPYVTTFSNQAIPKSTVTQVLEFIVADLLAAKVLLKEADPILSGDYVIGYPGTSASKEENDALFLHNRRHRMNYYAVCGTLARVYLYKQDKPNALKNALEVIDSQKFPWTDKEDFNNDDEEKKDRILYKELLFAWYIDNLGDAVKERFENDSYALSTATAEGNTIFEVASVGAEDYRYKQWLREKSVNAINRLIVRKYHREQSNLHPLVAPALRISELYYIAAECTFDEDPEKAWAYFNTVRYHRGIGTEIHDEPAKDTFLAELLKEARKEFYAEGQIFYMYKRLNQAIIGQAGNVYPASDHRFVIPLPDDELAFGQ